MPPPRSHLSKSFWSSEIPHECAQAVDRELRRSTERDDAFFLGANPGGCLGNLSDNRRRHQQQPTAVAEQHVASRDGQARDLDRLAEIDDVRKGVGYRDARREELKTGAAD